MRLHHKFHKKISLSLVFDFNPYNGMRVKFQIVIGIVQSENCALLPFVNIASHESLGTRLRQNIDQTEAMG